jgi:serine protease AprX
MKTRSGTKASESRSSALWGTGSRGGDSRSSALWGQRRRTLASVVGAMLALAMPLAATADPGSGKGKSSEAAKASSASQGSAVLANMPQSLLDAATANPGRSFDVIVQGTGRASGALAATISELTGADRKSIRREFRAVQGVAATLTGADLLKLASSRHVYAITRDEAMKASSFSTTQQWPHAAGLAKLWSRSGGTLPAIAIVDSGIESGRADFAGRIRASVNLSSLPGNSAGDGRGHGTFVASIAAGSALKYAGAAPGAPIVSIDVMDDRGMALVSDVIAAADWILANKNTHNIRVANFSLHTASPSNLRFDPLNRAVEKLWFSGVVVVASAGNYGTGATPSGVPFAPGNDPFVITVGAGDIAGTVAKGDDGTAPWSAWGYTVEGFAKPHHAAPGPYMTAAVPAGATLALERPASVVAAGYMQLSGTSFAAPAVAGAAAALLAQNPSWTPDQVKGALMVSASRAPNAPGFSAGVGMLDAAKAAAVTDPPNPNAGLNQFLTTDPLDGSTMFDTAAWNNAAWNNAAWNNAAWSSAAWSSAAWSSAAWSSAAWSSAAWNTAAWSSAAWSSAAWNNLATEDATLDVIDGEGYTLSAADAIEVGYTVDLMLELGLLEGEGD